MRSRELSPLSHDSIEKLSVVEQDFNVSINFNITRKTRGSTNVYESTQLGVRAGTAMQSYDDRFASLQDNSTPFDTRGGTVMSSIDDNLASGTHPTTPHVETRRMYTDKALLDATIDALNKRAGTAQAM